MDSTLEISAQDVRIAGLVHEEGKPSILVMNKWDLIDKHTNTIYEYKNMIGIDFAFMSYAPNIFISAKTGRRVDKLIGLVDSVYGNSVRRIRQAYNDCLYEATTNTTTIRQGRRLKLYYGTQVSIRPLPLSYLSMIQGLFTTLISAISKTF